jgi:tetratricopeptide (TPR) repeat protein
MNWRVGVQASACGGSTLKHGLQHGFAMRGVIFHVFLALLLSGTVRAREDSANAFFQDGLAASQAGQYAKAARAFRDSLAHQPATGTLLNLGLAEWRRGRVGDAILSWEQAVWIDPFNHDARNNLHFARQLAEVETPELFWYETASTWLPANAWAWLASGSLWLAIGMVTLPGVLRWRKAGWHQAMAAVSFAVFLLSIPAHVGVITRSHIGIVLARNAPLRLTPTQEAEATTILNAGEPGRKIRARGDYVFVRTQRGSGWVEQRQFGLVCPR